MRMKVSFPGGSRVDAEFDAYRVATDQPVRHGGGGTAPAPFDYFLASLGTCAGYYVLRFLERRGLSTQDASLELNAIRDPLNGRIVEIRFSVRLPEDFPEKYETAILKSIDLCAVKQHLEQPPAFRTDVVIGRREARPTSPREASVALEKG